MTQSQTDTDDDTCAAARPTAPRTIIIRTGILDAVDTAHKHCESAGFIHTFHTTASDNIQHALPL